jgi:hypothetical protein
MKAKIENLIKLLDDENPQTAQAAMAEMLKHESELEEFLAHHQESDNPLLRKRIHQLQAIITVRARRKNFAKIVKDRNLSLLQGLLEVHLQWYDNDSERGILTLWNELLATAQRYNPSTLEKLAYFMRKCGFTTSPKDELQADYFCLGPVLEELIGADFILCAIAREIAASRSLDIRIIRLLGEFALVDADGKILTPKNGWQLIPQIQAPVWDFWDNEKILKLASSMLFLFAVSSDSFRYVSTIGESLLQLANDGDLDFLPYPYTAKEKEDQK